MCNEMKSGWDLASIAKVHLQQMDDAHEAGNNDAAEREFEQALRLMMQARQAFMAEIVALYLNDETAE